MEFTNAHRRAFVVDLTFAGTPEQVFPLLCPVREYDWIPGWAGTLVYSRSGIAELGCVFRTEHPAGPEIWTVSRYQPGQAIGFVRVVAGLWTVLMDLELAPTTTGQTSVRTRHTFTALSPAGAAAIDAMDEEHHRMLWQNLAELAGHYLRTGTMRPEQPTPA